MNVVKEHTEQIETNQEPSEKEDTETVDATDAANSGDKTMSEVKIQILLLTFIKLQLYKYETAPNFIRLSQNLTLDCLLI